MSLEPSIVPGGAPADARPSRSQPTRHPVHDAEAGMVRAFADNAWFVGRHWPQNRERILGLVAEIMRRHAPERGPQRVQVRPLSRL